LRWRRRRILPLIALFFRATLTVQLVMIALIVASVYVWAITFSKYTLYRRARANAQAFDAAFWSGEPLDELYDQVAAASRAARRNGCSWLA
jgi:biopolymer transport protein TolQ